MPKNKKVRVFGYKYLIATPSLTKELSELAVTLMAEDEPSFGREGLFIAYSLTPYGTALLMLGALRKASIQLGLPVFDYRVEDVSLEYNPAGFEVTTKTPIEPDTLGPILDKYLR